MNGKLIARFAIREATGVVFMAVALLWSAGEIAWWPAWALIVLTAAWVLATGVVIVRRSPELLAERLGPRHGAKRWDTLIMGINGILQLGMYVVAGLDHRFGWTTGISVTAQIVGLLACVLGYSLVVWATATNAFFSQIVRIQTERGHTVVSDGPYRYIRHPAYAGSLLTTPGAGILLGSWWTLALGLVDAALMVVRTALEDQALRGELPGYADYAGRVRQRLVPGIW